MVRNIVVTKKFVRINRGKYEHQKSVLGYRICLKGNMLNVGETEASQGEMTRLFGVFFILVD